MAGVKCTVVDQKVLSLIGGMGQKLKSLAPALKTVGQIIRTSVVRNFEVGGRPRSWKESKRAERESGRTLADTGRLRNSIHAAVTGNRIEVGTNVKYAAIHQFGGKTSPHMIFPKNGKALFWPGARHPVKSVNHPGSNIPARPFLMIQKEDWAEIKRVLGKFTIGGKG